MSYYRDNLPEILRKCKQLERRGFYIIRSRKVQVYKDYTFIVVIQQLGFQDLI